MGILEKAILGGVILALFILMTFFLLDIIRTTNKRNRYEKKVQLREERDTQIQNSNGKVKHINEKKGKDVKKIDKSGLRVVK